MNSPAQRQQAQIDDYLAKLRQALSGLPANDIEEILRELRGHLDERAMEGDSEHGQTPLEHILRQFGTPEYIGSLYRADARVARARETFSPALIMGSTIRWATRTGCGFLAFMVGLAGYALGASLMACALLKPFSPTHIGLWINPHGMLFGYTLQRPHSAELLGWWVIPIGLVAGTASVLGTTAFLRWMLRFVPQTSRRVFAAR